MQQTDNLQLNLPEYTDTVDIEQLNDNFRKLDTSAALPSNSVPSVPSVNGNTGTETTYARGDHSHPAEVCEIVITQGGTTSNPSYTTDRTFVEIKAAFDAGKFCCAKLNTLSLVLCAASSGTLRFSASQATIVSIFTITSANVCSFTQETMQESISATGIIKRASGGAITAAEAGTDYITPDQMTSAIQAAIQNTWEASY